MGRRIRGAGATRLFKSILPRVYWAVDLGVPVFRRWRGYGRLRRLRLVPPGDIRPCLERDEAILREAMERFCSREFAERVLGPRPLVLLNKIQSIDAADEVIVAGYSIGAREYDVYTRSWVFKPMYYGVKLIVDEELAPFIRVHGPLRGDELLSPGDYTGSLPEASRWVPIASGRRGVYGLGKAAGDGRVRVVRVWRLDEETDFRPIHRTIDDAVRANREHLEEIEADAVSFLRGLRVEGTRIVNVSGGKDSTVAAYIAAEAGIKSAMFLDTGLEFPEAISIVEALVEKLGLSLIRIESGDVFWRSLGFFGPPARDYRWCCKVVKLSFVARRLKRMFDRVVSIVGQRRYESTQRALAGRLAASGSTAYDYIAAPIQEWTSLEVHMLIRLRRLPLNPLYKLGYERIGCFMCPTSRLAEIEAVRSTHRSLWSKWIGYLEGYARSHRLPREWIDYGLWRWRFRYPGEVIHLIRRLGLRPRDLVEKTLSTIASSSIEPLGDRVCILLNVYRIESIDLHAYTRYLRAIERSRAIVEETGDHVTARIGDAEARIYRDGRITVCGSPSGIPRILERIAPPALMTALCINCGLCEAACPTGAIKPGNIDPSRCRGCRRCTHICPVASSYTKHLLEQARITLGAL